MKASRLLLMCSVVALVAACAHKEEAKNEAMAPVAVAPEAPSKVEAPKEPEALYVYFARGSAQLDPDAEKVADQAAGLYRQGNPSVMNVVGHTDPAGTEFSNLVLSAKRAETVKQALVKRGIPAKALQVLAAGTSDPAVPGANQDEAKDRRAVITWH
jgi:OOP family OmpA-OmpF porin